jgi:hypothetical protein
MMRMQWVAVAAAVAVIAGGAAAAREHAGDTSRTPTAGQPGPPGAGPLPDDWRYESYDGVQVRVPPTWGWGGAPMSPTGDGQLYDCGSSAAFVVPGSDAYEFVDDTVPFVGRPAMMTDACQGPAMAPGADAVWLGSPLPVGTDSSGKVVAETIALAGQHVSAFSDDSALRSQILGTAEAVTTDANGCPTEPRKAPAPGPADGAQAASLSVCVYDGGRLLWSTTKDQQHAQDYVDAFSQASATFDAASLCTKEPVPQWVAVGVHDTDPNAPVRWDIVNFDCDRIVGTYTYGSQGKQSQTEAPLVPATVAPWAGGGIKAYVAGPFDPRHPDAGLGEYFRGMLG